MTFSYNIEMSAVQLLGINDQNLIIMSGYVIRMIYCKPDKIKIVFYLLVLEGVHRV